MIEINISSNIQDVIKNLDNVEKRKIPQLEREFINNIAFDTLDSIKKTIKGQFKGKDLSRAVRIRKATAKRHYAKIYVDDRHRWKENALTVFGLGGDRARKSTERMLIRAGHMKPYEILTPDAKINRGIYTKIASQLQLFYKAGFDANETARSRVRNNAKGGIHSRYFIVTSSKYAITNDLGKIKKRKTGLAPGIYVLAYDKVRGTTGEKVWRRLNPKPIRLLKISKKPHYEKKYDMKKIFDKVYARRGDKHLEKAFDYVFRNKKGTSKWVK